MRFDEIAQWSIDKTFKQLSTTKNGLSEREVKSRQKKYGYNSISQHQLTILHLLIKQLKFPFIYLLFFAASISFLLGNIVEGWMLIFFVVFNKLLGFYQEYQSDQILRALEKYLEVTSKVRRDGQEVVVASKFLVPGDIVILEPGDLISADIRFIKTNNVTVDESSLTGESTPVAKDTTIISNTSLKVYQADNIGFSGTLIVSGKAEGIVFAIGDNTQFGAVSRLAMQEKKSSNFAQEMKQFSILILYAVAATLIIIFILNFLIKGNKESILDFFIFSVALAVAITPEALPLIVTFSLARGARQLANNKVIVKRLAAIEDLGSVQLLCTDKTGTLTENVLELAEILSNDDNFLLFANVVSSGVKDKRGKLLNPFEHALQAVLSQELANKMSQITKLFEVPFEPERLRATAIIQMDNQRFVVCRGAYEAIKPLCSAMRPEINEQWVTEYGLQGKRVLAVAIKKLDQHTNIEDEARNEQHLTMIGLVSFIDPIKKDVIAAINKAKKLGVNIKILTGDAPEVALAIGKQIGLITDDKQMITGQQFDKTPNAKKVAVISQESIFARVTPVQKFAIIQLLQKENFVVGYLGDGINDAPALNIADVGIVVKGASDIARQAADIVILQKSLYIIIQGIYFGRTIFTNIVKYIKISLSSRIVN